MSTPVIILNSSPERWTEVPFPEVAQLILPGLALAWATNSATVFAGTAGFTSITFGTRMKPATGSVSRMKLKDSFG